MIKILLVNTCLLVSSLGFALDKTITEGVVQLPQELILVDHDGLELKFGTSELNDEFVMTNNNAIAIGRIEHKDPFLGFIKEDLIVSLEIDNQLVLGKFDSETSTYVPDTEDTPAIPSEAVVTLIIPKGTEVYGFYGDTNSLVSLTLMGGKIDIKNSRPFKINISNSRKLDL